MSYSSEVLADSPNAYYRLGEPSGTTMVDSSGNGRNGTYDVGVTLGATGALVGDGDTAAAFASTVDGTVPSSAGVFSGVSATVTLEAWFKTTDTGVNTIAARWGISTSQTATLDLQTSNGIRFYVRAGGATRIASATITGLRDGNWHHIVGTYDGTNVRLYVDGTVRATLAATGAVDTSGSGSGNFTVGTRDGSNGFTGTIDEVAVYPTALSAARITAHYDVGMGASSPITAALAGVQQVDVADFTVSPIIDAALAGTERPDEAAFALNIDAPAEVEFAGVERRESTAFTMAAECIASLAGVEQRDVGAFSTDVSKTLTLAGTERRDTAAFVAAIPPTATLAGVEQREVAAFALAKQPSTDLGRISGRSRGGYGVATWFPPVVPLPQSDMDGPKMWVAAAFGPQTMGGADGTQPVYTISEAHIPRERQQIIVDGLDITGFRGVVTPDVTYQRQEPLLYGPADLTLPQVACSEEFGTGDLSWLREDATVTVNMVLDDIVVRTAYKGFINAFNVDGAHPVIELGGEAHGALEMMNRQPVAVPRVNDIGHQLAVDLDEAGIPHHPPLGRVTGIETLTTGGTGLLEHFHAVIAQGWTRAGRQWTVMPDPATGVYETHRKDDTTIHWTAFIDDARTTLSVRRDTSEESNRIYGTGVTRRGMRVRNVIIPGLYQGPVPEFPGHMKMGDTGVGVQMLIGKLQAVNYLDLRDTPGGYDEDVYEAVVDLQNDAGMFEDGFTGTAVPGEVNLATWRALYDVDITQQSLAWARTEPMSQASKVKEWRRSGTGGILGPNPGHDKTVRKRDRNLDYGSGLTRKQMFEFSKAERQDADAPNWYGTVTCHTGALLRGEVAIGATITAADVAAATEALPGHNLWVPNFQGGTLFHIAAAQLADNGIVTFTIDTRFRDAMEVWEVMERNKEAKRDPARRRNQRHRSSTIVKDSIGEWYEHGGIIGHDVKLEPGWNVFEVIGAMEGIIARFRLVVQTTTLDGETITIQGHEFACAVFGREITPAKLAQIVPAPLTADGKKNWRRKATRDQLRAHWVLASFGTDEEPCGYGEDLKSDGATLTGVMDEDGGFPYRSESRSKLYIAVFVKESAVGAVIPAGRTMWPQLEAAV